MRLIHLLSRLAAIVVIAVSVGLVVQARVSTARVERQERCFSQTWVAEAHRYERDASVAVARQCGIEDPAPRLPVGVPALRRP